MNNTANQLQYYPTNQAAFDMATAGMDFSGKRIFDPSAGQGHFLKFAYRSNYRKLQMFAMEIDPDRNAMLKGFEDPSIEVWGTDFMDASFHLPKQIDIVLMNPPFRVGANHLVRMIKLLEVQSIDSTIVCLLNKKSLTSPSSDMQRAVAQYIKQYSAEVLDLGKCFPNLRVEVSCIRMKIKGASYEADWLEGLGDQLEDLEMEQGDVPVKYSTKLGLSESEIKRKVAAYNRAIARHGVVCKAINDLDRDTQIARGNKGIQIVRGYGSAHTLGVDALDVNTWRARFTKRCWSALFGCCTLDRLVSSTQRYQLEEEFLKEYGAYAFTLKNIYTFLHTLAQGSSNIIKAMVAEVFNINTRGNRSYRTNRNCEMKAKFNWSDVMIDLIGRLSHRVSYDSQNKLEALDKMVCGLLGMQYSDIRNCIDTLNDKDKCHFGGSFDDAVDSEFFVMKRYRNGSIHFWVKEKAAWAWEEANRIAGRMNGTPLPNGDDWKATHKWAPNRD